MPCPAAVSAAAAALWLWAALGPGLSVWAQEEEAASAAAASAFSLCGDCFHRQTAPRGGSQGPGLQPLCHTLPGGQAFATLSKSACDTAVYSAFRLGHGWTEEGEERSSEDEAIKAAPALLRRAMDPSLPASPLQHWDSTVTALVQSSISPRCSAAGGHLYILIGAGGLEPAGDGDEQCQVEPLWSAMCCSVPEGDGDFGLGLIRQTGGDDRQVSMKELEEALGVDEMFPGGCGGGADVGTVLVPLSLEDAEKTEEDAGGERTGDTDVDAAGSGTEGENYRQDAEAETNRQDTEAGEAPAAAAADDDDDADVQSEEAAHQEASAGAVESSRSGGEEQRGARRSADPVSEASPGPSAEQETLEEQETDTNSTSTLLYILTTTLSILKAPLDPVVSRVTSLPGQVSYVLQEDLGVLSQLPADTYSLLHLLTSDLLSWTGSAVDLLWGVGENCFDNVYYCSSSLLGALYGHCHSGVAGVGTLAGDTVGVAGDVVDHAWWVTKLFGGRLWEHSEGYVGSVVGELGGQTSALGGGLGKLVWRSGSGVWNVFQSGVGFILGIVNVVSGAFGEGFGRESE